jgi:uncharacterized ParB-like nuclease family protein
LDYQTGAGQRKELDQAKLDTVIEGLLEGEPKKPIRVREGKGRYVLIEGIHRLEANKAVGEDTIGVFIVQARKF